MLLFLYKIIYSWSSWVHQKYTCIRCLFLSLLWKLLCWMHSSQEIISLCKHCDGTTVCFTGDGCSVNSSSALAKVSKRCFGVPCWGCCIASSACCLIPGFWCPLCKEHFFTLGWKEELTTICHCIVSAVSSFFFLRKKKQLCHFCKRKSFVSAEIRLEEQHTVFFSYFWLFYWNTFRWMGLFLKYSKLKCSQGFSRLGLFILFCFFVHRVMTDLPSPLAHLLLRQVTGTGRKILKNKIKMPACLFVLWREGSICSCLCLWHCCERIYPVTWVSLEKHKGRDNREEVCPQAERRVWLV